MKLKAFVVGVALAAGFGASLAVAAVPAKHGPPTVAVTTAGDTTSTSTTVSRGHKPSTTGPACRPKVALVLKGTLAWKASTSFRMQVTQANRHAYARVGSEVTVNVDARTKVVRRGPSSLDKLVLGDRLNVQARACKAERDTAAELLARRVVATPAKTVSSTSTTQTTGTS
jgi:hypothetical protein